MFKGNAKSVRLSESSSYRGLKLSGVNCIAFQIDVVYSIKFRKQWYTHCILMYVNKKQLQNKRNIQGRTNDFGGP